MVTRADAELASRSISKIIFLGNPIHLEVLLLHIDWYGKGTTYCFELGHLVHNHLRYICN